MRKGSSTQTIRQWLKQKGRGGSRDPGNNQAKCEFARSRDKKRKQINRRGRRKKNAVL
jgi:hypothetical protein